MTTQKRFAEDWKMDVDRVHMIVSLAKECARANEHSVNGDPHPRNPVKDDKNANSKLWLHDCDVLTASLERYISSYGFTGVVYTGLGPTLKRGDLYVEVPY